MKIIRLIRPLFAVAIAGTLLGGKAAEAPRLLPFQGRLTDPLGNAVSNGVRLVQFRIYSAPNGGTPAWGGEIHRTTVNGGLVNVLLGSKTPLNGVDFNQQLFLEITVDINGDNSITAADPPLLPRQSILPVTFAKESGNASKLAGRDWSSILVNGNDPASPTNYVRGNKLEPASITLDKLAQAVIDQLAPPGTIVAFGGTTPPPGWLACDGSVLSSFLYEGLFEAIGYQWGYGDIFSTFRLPDLRGQFLRGDSQGNGGLDPDWLAGRYANYPGGALNGVGSYQYFATARPVNSAFVTGGESHAHTHNYFDGHFAEAQFAAAGNQNQIGSRAGYDADNGVVGTQRRTSGENEGHTHTVVSGGDNETRPRNAAVLFIIKY